MGKKSDFKKSELLQILNSASSLREKNKAVKLLRKFDPNPKKHLDSSFMPNQATVTKYSSLQSFLCWRCDKIKQTMTKVKWETKEEKFITFYRPEDHLYHLLHKLSDLLGSRQGEESNTWF